MDGGDANAVSLVVNCESQEEIDGRSRPLLEFAERYTLH